MTAAHRRWYEEAASAATPQAEVVRSEPTRRIRPAWIVNTLAALAVALLLMVALGVVDTGGDVATVTMLVGVPVILVVITTLIVARRSR